MSLESLFDGLDGAPSPKAGEPSDAASTGVATAALKSPSSASSSSSSSSSSSAAGGAATSLRRNSFTGSGGGKGGGNDELTGSPSKDSGQMMRPAVIRQGDILNQKRFAPRKDMPPSSMILQAMKRRYGKQHGKHKAPQTAAECWVSRSVSEPAS